MTHKEALMALLEAHERHERALKRVDEAVKHNRRVTDAEGDEAVAARVEYEKALKAARESVK